MRSEEKRQQTKTVQDFGKVKKKKMVNIKNKKLLLWPASRGPDWNQSTCKSFFSFQLVCDDRSILHRLFLVHSRLYWGLKGVWRLVSIFISVLPYLSSCPLKAWRSRTWCQCETPGLSLPASHISAALWSLNSHFVPAETFALSRPAMQTCYLPGP